MLSASVRVPWLLMAPPPPIAYPKPPRPPLKVTLLIETVFSLLIAKMRSLPLLWMNVWSAPAPTSSMSLFRQIATTGIPFSLSPAAAPKKQGAATLKV